MKLPSRLHDRERPENLVLRLVAQLSHHALWDSLLIFLPPVLALIYSVVVLSHTARISDLASLLVIVVAVGFGVLGVVLHYRPLIPDVSSAAQLVDQRSGANDRFLTLATIEPTSSPASLVVRLSQETAGFMERVELKRDFPYNLKRSAYWSVGLSLIAAILVHFLVPLAEPGIQLLPVQQRLSALAEKLAQKPALNGLAKELRTLAARLEDPKIHQEEKQALAQEIEKQIEEQQKKEEQQENRDLLGEAASTLKGVEKEQSASGQDQQKDQQKGGGGIQSNLPQKGQGDSKQSQGGEGQSKNDPSTQPSKDMQSGNSAQGKPKEPGQEKNQQSGDAKGDQPNPNQPGTEQSKEKIGKGEGTLKEGASKDKASEEPPQGAPPAERFYKTGEGKEGISGARYVTVQLPEEMAADSKGTSRATKESKGTRARSQVPVSNVPLPAHVPNAPTEKQQLPIEYRGIIR
jgi:uncharacterized membrane protein YhaH (DUF805 family)